MMNLQEAVAKLNALESEQAVVDLLIDEGVTGFIKNSRECPIAHYLQDHVTTHNTIGVGTGTVWDSLLDYSYVLSDHVREFIRHFDTGAYPELVSPEPALYPET